MGFIRVVYVRILPLIVNCFFASLILINTGCAGHTAISSPAELVRVSPDTGSGQITLAWDDVPGDVLYYLYVSKTTGAKEFGERFVNVANPVTITNLKVGTTYYYVVTSVRFGTESEPSEEISFLVK